MSPELQLLWIIARGHLARARDDERGVSAVEWILITLALIGMALVVARLITNEIKGKAGEVSL
jgi:Flp pilus assembly protein TadG